MRLPTLLCSRVPVGLSVTVLLNLGVVLCLGAQVAAQHQSLPYLRADRNSTFTQLDFAELYLQQQTRDDIESTITHLPSDKSATHGSVPALDLAAPQKAVRQYQRGLLSMKGQHSKDAIHYLQRAVEIYPNFISAHNALGVAYLDQHQDDLAKAEFQRAAQLDDHFTLSFVNLGVLALRASDYSTADSNLEKAASLSSGDPMILAALAFAQNGSRQYTKVLSTVKQIHRLDPGHQATVHYVAASAAQSLHDFDAMQRELTMFLEEDPTNPLAPVARKYLDHVHRPGTGPVKETDSLIVDLEPSASISEVLTFPNTQRLHSELSRLEDPNDHTCETCDEDSQPSVDSTGLGLGSSSTYTTWNHVFTIHQAVDETAVFFAVSQGGRAVNDLSLSDIQVRDDNKAPDRVLQFTPQSKLPLRLGLLIDTSGSVEHRIPFEKRAAAKFMDKVLNPESDLAFVAGFNKGVHTTQDFTNDPAALARGMENLPRVDDGTSVFDAVYYACWKLAAYPDEGRVAKVLVILTDGEDNASRRTLQESIDEAEAAGVTIYTINTSDYIGYPTDANQVLKTMADRTGGESMAPGNLRDLDRYLSELPEVIRSRYLIAYRPADFAPDGKYRTIRVTAAKDGKLLRVHARKGYYARQAEKESAKLADASAQ